MRGTAEPQPIVSRRAVPSGSWREELEWCSNMASVGCNFLCRECDEKICDEKFSYKVKKEKAYVSGNYVCCLFI